MKRYLERLAASVSRPQSRLHPVAGSIFADERREEIAEVALPTVSEHSSERRKAEPTPPTPQAERSLPTQEPATAHPEERPGRPQPIGEKPSAFSPLLPPKILEVDPVGSQIREAATGAAAQPHLQSRAARIDPTQHGLEMPMQQRGIISDPLLLRPLEIKKSDDKRNSEAAEKAQEHAQPVEPLIKPITRVAPSEVREIVPASETRERSETEDIQIHIGRIEVIAVPPPGVRAAATPANRFTSLDDYLKRRDGRAR